MSFLQRAAMGERAALTVIQNGLIGSGGTGSP